MGRIVTCDKNAEDCGHITYLQPSEVGEALGRPTPKGKGEYLHGNCVQYVSSRSAFIVLYFPD